MGLADNAARRAGEVIKPAPVAPTRNRRTTARPQPTIAPAAAPAAAPAPAFDWAKEYGRGVNSGVVADAQTLGGVTQGNETFQSGVDIGKGEGDVWDYLNVLGAATALGGYGAGKGISALDRLAALRVANSTLNNPRVSIYAPREVMTDVLQSRFKNQFEVQPERVAANTRRLEVETGLGVPLNAAPWERPIYGAIENKYNLPSPVLKYFPGTTGQVLRTTDPRFNASGLFGSHYPTISHLDARNAQGTYTVGDSFVPSQGRFSHFILNDPYYNKRGAEQLVDSLRRGDPVPYVEAQLQQNILDPFSGQGSLTQLISGIDAPLSGSELMFLTRAAANVPPGLPGSAEALRQAARSNALRDLIAQRNQSIIGDLQNAAVYGGNKVPRVNPNKRTTYSKAEFDTWLNDQPGFLSYITPEMETEFRRLYGR